MANHPNIKKVYNTLLYHYGPQGWWPIVNNKTLMCEYFAGAPKNEAERFEIAVGAVLAQNTQWYPNVVRAIQQLKIGRPFTKEELKLIRYAEWLYHKEFGNKGCKIDKPINAKIVNNHNEAEILSANISRREQLITKEDIFTQNTSWKNVEKALLNLKKEKLLNKQAIQKVSTEKLAQLIRSAGYFNQKAKKLKALVSYTGHITRDNLLSIWGIGKETADSILCYAYHHPIFVVDTYTHRIFHRLGYQEQGYDAIQQLVMKELSTTEEYNEFHALLVELGKNVCTKTKPKCSSCPLTKSCKKIIEEVRSA